MPDACSQFCVNSIGSYICKCAEGYVKTSDNRTCKKRDGRFTFGFLCSPAPCFLLYRYYELSSWFFQRCYLTYVSYVLCKAVHKTKSWATVSVSQKTPVITVARDRDSDSGDCSILVVLFYLLTTTDFSTSLGRFSRNFATRCGVFWNLVVAGMVFDRSLRSPTTDQCNVLFYDTLTVLNTDAGKWKYAFV